MEVVVVAYHAADELDRALAPLGDLPVTVVDNSQSDAVRAVAAAHSATYVRTEANLGFAAGANRALRPRLAGAPADVLLLNPDAVITADGVATLASSLRASPRAAAIAPRVVGESGRDERVHWPFPSPWWQWLEAVGLARLRGGATFAIGAVLLLRWEALQEVGLLDERFFLYAEETDWQYRARSLGWETQRDDRVVATHVGAASSADERYRTLLFHAAHELYVRKWHGTSGWFVYRSAAIAGAAARTVLLRGRRQDEARFRLRLYVRGPRSALLDAQ